MRVIAGKAKRIQLKCIEGLETRPTTDRIKETLFNMLAGDLYGCVFLDLFSGSGAIGIEALSRGAEKAVFVEKSSEAVKCIQYNLERTRLKLQAEVVRQDCLSAIRTLSQRYPHFDIVFMDPPYRQDLEFKVLGLLADISSVDQDTQIIIEAALETSFDHLEEIGFELVREKKYKTNKHVFVRKVQTKNENGNLPG